MKKLILLFAAFLTPVVATAEDKKPESAVPVVETLSNPEFELFRFAPGQAEAFMREFQLWDQVNVAGGLPRTQLYLFAGGEGWDVMLYKAPRRTPTPEQKAAMSAKMKELGLVSGPLFFLKLRGQIAGHSHLIMSGPTLVDDWLAELDAQRAAQKTQGATDKKQ